MSATVIWMGGPSSAIVCPAHLILGRARVEVECFEVRSLYCFAHLRYARSYYLLVIITMRSLNCLYSRTQAPRVHQLRELILRTRTVLRCGPRSVKVEADISSVTCNTRMVSLARHVAQRRGRRSIQTSSAVIYDQAAAVPQRSAKCYFRTCNVTQSGETSTHQK